MKSLSPWLYILSAVAISLLGNSVSAVWAKGESKLSLWLLVLIILSPLVFISFGLVTARLGLAVTAGTVDALLTLSTIAVGLVAFREWDKLSTYQYLGMLLAVVGIILMVFFRKQGG